MERVVILSEEDMEQLRELLQNSIVSQDMTTKQYALRLIAIRLGINIEGGMADK